jgi:uncharacterized membrane protein YqhA
MIKDDRVLKGTRVLGAVIVPFLLVAFALLLLGIGLILLGVIRAWGDFDTSNALTYVFVGGISLLLAGLVALVVVMERPLSPAEPLVPA